ncbi:MAG: (Fe-S)-binding protein [Armatimonadota bacterium]|nr:(Fe-S)-binding protein [Armatimonadota bacterium]
MLTIPERVLFILFTGACLASAGVGFWRVFGAIRRGQGGLSFSWGRLPQRVLATVIQVLLHRTLLRTRRIVALFHSFIFFAFSFYFLVNLFDLLEGFTGFSTLHKGGLWATYNLVADLLSVLALIGMVYFLVRRFVFHPGSFAFNPEVMLLPGVEQGIRRDSAIVGGFILLHVGARWTGQAMKIALEGPDPWQPLASSASVLFSDLPEGALVWGIHLTWWLALGLILLFLPYFPYSKHIHLLFAPINLTLGLPEPPGQITQAGNGAARLEELPWRRILDAYACIMCNRCQDACPAHTVGKSLSPAALEINKRIYLNAHLREFSRGASSPPMWEYAISKEAIWACTTCSGCVHICPVGNAPMLDIVNLRRRLLEEGEISDPNLQDVLVKLGKYGNSFGKPERQRGQWVKGLPFPVKDARRESVGVLWFVGDFASFDPRVQEISRTVARILHHAGVDFGILYDGERNSGNDIRRVGEEGLFEILAEHNIRALDQASYQLILTTDPHTLNALRNEYRQFGREYSVVHYTEFLVRLFQEGRLRVQKPLGRRVTYHDPCYLARYNRVTDAPRRLLAIVGAELVEMPRNRENTFCCGAGGGRIWMSEEPGKERPSENRIREAVALGVEYFIVACPKDYAMFTDAVKTSGNEGRIVVEDIAGLVAEAVGIPVEVAQQTSLTSAGSPS